MRSIKDFQEDHDERMQNKTLLDRLKQDMKLKPKKNEAIDTKFSRKKKEVSEADESIHDSDLLGSPAVFKGHNKQKLKS